MNPEGEFSDSESVENTEEVFEHKKGVTFGPAAMVLIGVACLAVVFWFIYSIWTTPENTEPAPTSEEQVLAPVVPDPTVVPGRDPKVLGIRIDTQLGRFFTLPDTGQTLYTTDEECINACLEDWTPYTAETAFENNGLLSTFERPDDGTLQYQWDGGALYTFNLDNDRSVLGDGYNGTWKIARP